jgi:hypothetical protein
MGEGNVGIEDWVRRYLQLCPGKTLSLEVIVTAPRVFACYDPKFWDAYRRMPAWEFARLLALAERGTPRPAPPPADKEAAGRREREDLEVSLRYTRHLLQRAAG